jgi:hypothetical protein
MIPKEKAKELVIKYYTFGINKEGQLLSWYEAKECALIAVDEMIKTAKDVFEHCWNHISWKAQYDIVDMNKYLSYLEEVKQEIEKS